MRAGAVFTAVLTALRHRPVELTGEEHRLIERCRSDRWEQMTTERGLAGLTIGWAEEWSLGYRIVCHLGGRLVFGDVEDKAMHLATGLGLVRGHQAVTDDHTLPPDVIAVAMVKAHRMKQRGSVVMVLRGDRSDRVDIWLGLHDRLAVLADGMDARDAAQRAQNAASQAVAAPGRTITPEQAAEAAARSRAFYAEYTRTAGTTAGDIGSVGPNDVPAVSRRGTNDQSVVPARDTVCGRVRAVLSECPAGLSARDIADKTGASVSRVHDCLSRGLDAGEFAKNGRSYVAVPDVG